MTEREYGERFQQRRFDIYETKDLLNNPEMQPMLDDLYEVNTRAFGELPDRKSWLKDSTHVLVARIGDRVVGGAEYTRRMVGINPRGLILEDFEKKVLYNNWYISKHNVKPGRAALYINYLYVDPDEEGKGVGTKLNETLFDMYDPLYVLSYSRNAAYIATHQKAAERLDHNNPDKLPERQVFVGGVPLGDYPVSYPIYRFHSFLRNEVHTSYSHFSYKLKRDQVPLRTLLNLELINNLREQNLIHQFKSRYPTIMVGLDRPEPGKEAIRGEIVLPKWGSLLDRRLDVFFDYLLKENSRSPQTLTIPVLTIDPTSFPREMPLGTFEHYELSEDYHIRALNWKLKPVEYSRSYGPEKNHSKELRYPNRYTIIEIDKVLQDPLLVRKLWDLNTNAFGVPPNAERNIEKWLAGSTHMMVVENNGEIIGAVEYTHRKVGIEPAGGILPNIEKNVLNQRENKNHHNMKVGTNILFINSFYVHPENAGRGTGVELHRKLNEYIDPAVTISFSKNAQYIAAFQRASEDLNADDPKSEATRYVYAGGIPLGDYPLYLSVHQLFEQITAGWYKNFNELYLYLKESNYMDTITNRGIVDMFQKGMWEHRSGGIGVKMTGFSREGKIRNEPLQGELIYPRKDTKLDQRLGNLFTMLDFWNREPTLWSHTIPIVAVDPNRFPVHITLGTFSSTQFSVNPVNKHSPLLREMLASEELHW